MTRRQVLILLALTALLGSGSASAAAKAAAPPVTLVLGAYTTPREAYGKLAPLFSQKWQAQSGGPVSFQESYLGSGAQSRAIVEGFEADIAALSLEADVDRIVKARLITHDWKSGATKGIVTTSVVVFAVRPGNPKGIKDWADLARPGVEILTPNPKTSGGAMWNILALCGAAERGYVTGVAKGDRRGAFEFLKKVLRNVTVMDKGARESITNFEKGVGDVAITYENEVLVAKGRGENYDYVIPRATILIENPIAIVDVYATKHGVRKAAEAFVEFLFTPEAQKVFAAHGLRSVNPEVAKETAKQYPPVQDLFTIAAFGGWARATPQFFGDAGEYTRAIAEIQAR